jgi:GTP-binding protein
VLSKADLVPAEDAEAARETWATRLGEDVPVLVTSSATGQGIDELAAELLRRVPVEPAAVAAEPATGDEEALAEHRVFRPAADRGFRVERAGDGVFRVTGPRVERLLLRFDLENEEAAAHVERRLDRMGVIRALEENGFAPGDDVEIAGQVFELDPRA